MDQVTAGAQTGVMQQNNLTNQMCYLLLCFLSRLNEDPFLCSLCCAPDEGVICTHVYHYNIRLSL